MCRQYASSTCSSPAASANTTSFVPNACTACGCSARVAVAERRRQPEAVPAAREPLRRPPGVDNPRTIHPHRSSHTHRLEHVLILWRWVEARKGLHVAEIGAYAGPEPAVVAAVADLLPVLRQRAQETEDNRDVPADSVKALTETGFFRLLQPASYGGLEADPIAFYTAVRLIASACGSTGWVASVLGVHPWQLALFPARAQEEVWGADPATRMSSSYAPTGRARARRGRVPAARAGGASPPAPPTRPGCCSAAIVLGDDGKPVDFCTFLLPASDYAVDDVWDTVGLRGTGSNDIVVERRLRPRAPGAELQRRHPVRLPRPGAQPRAAVPDPVRVGVHVRHHDAGHRHGDRGVRGARGLPARPGPRRVRGGEGRRRPVRPGAGRRGGGPCSTPRGWPSSGTWPS